MIATDTRPMNAFLKYTLSSLKGTWKPKKISNPDYKGVWIHPEIDNPNYVPDPFLYRYTDIGAIGFDLWQV